MDASFRVIREAPEDTTVIFPSVFDFEIDTIVEINGSLYWARPGCGGWLRVWWPRSWWIKRQWRKDNNV